MSDRNGKIEPLTISIVPGSRMPRYDDAVYELTSLGVTVTEQATRSGLPAVDFRFQGPDGTQFAFTTSGRMIQMLAAAIAGINVRNHGKADP